MYKHARNLEFEEAAQAARRHREDEAAGTGPGVLPLGEELLQTAGFTADPLGEAAARRTPQLQKYAGRALLITTEACAVHCRYCFRREFTYSPPDTGSRWGEALQVIAQDAGIEEVILSGGDPLSLSDARLTQLTGCLRAHRGFHHRGRVLRGLHGHVDGGGQHG